MNTKQILVTVPVTDVHKQLLERQAPGFTFVYKASAEVQPVDCMDKEIIIGNVPAKWVQNSTSLRWLQTNSAGVEGYTVPGALPAGALLTNATGAYGLAISEYMVTVLLMLMKKMHTYRDNQHAHLWQSLGQVRSIYGSTVLILGMGDIGGEFGRRVKAMGAYVIGVRRSDTRCPDYADEVHTVEELDALLPRADVVALSLPGTAQTRAMLNAARFAEMKPGSFLVNVGRGNAIDTDALLAALQSGQIAGAALDVTDPEPLPADHPLWDMPNCIVTPHVSGAYHLQETLERIIRISAENLAHYVQSEPLRNVVDFSTGYRKLPQ